MKIYKTKLGHYFKAVTLSNGEVISTEFFDLLEKSLTIQHFPYRWKDEQELLSQGYTEVTERNPDMTDLVDGDLIKDTDGNYHKILSRNGVGDDTFYNYSARSKEKDGENLKRAWTFYTAFQLRYNGYTPVVPGKPSPVKMTVKEVAEKLGHEVEIVKG